MRQPHSVVVVSDGDALIGDLDLRAMMIVQRNITKDVILFTKASSSPHSGGVSALPRLVGGVS